MKRAALLLLAGEELSISGSVTQSDDRRGKENPREVKNEGNPPGY